MQKLKRSHRATRIVYLPFDVDASPGVFKGVVRRSNRKPPLKGLIYRAVTRDSGAAFVDK